MTVMATGPTTDPQWPKLLSLTAHEFRSPLTVVSGYIRMLLKDRTGTLTDQHRRLLEEAEKSCSRLSSLLAEVSELGNFESQAVPFNRGSVDIHDVLAQSVAALPALPDRTSQSTCPENTPWFMGIPSGCGRRSPRFWQA